MSLFEDFLLPHNLDEDGEFMPLLSLDEDESLHTNESFPEVLPILALKNTVLFPGIVIPITVGRDKSIKAIYKAYKEDRIIAVLSQKDQRIEDPKPTDLYQIGTVARILKLLKMPDGTATAIIQGRKRITVQEFVSDEPYLSGKTKVLDETAAEEDDLEYKALISSIKDMAKEVIQLSPNIPSEAVVMLKK
ncbi:MAG: ATP-dependent Lon protease, partial [Saprospiraceae bacterium]